MHRSLTFSTALVTSLSMLLNSTAMAQTAETTMEEPSPEVLQACETPVGEPCEGIPELTVEQAGELKAQQMDAELSQDMDPNVRSQSIQQARIQAEDAQRAYLQAQADGSGVTTEQSTTTSTETAATPTAPAASEPATAEPTGTATADTTTDGTAPTDGTATATADSGTGDAAATTDGSTTTTTAEAEPVPAHQQREQTNAEKAAGVMPAAAAAAAADSGNAEAQVTEETVTADEVRTSDQDFANAVGEQPATTDANANANTGATATASSGNSGLTDKEKAILGLGALAIGAVALANRDVVTNSGDRVVVREGNDIVVLKDDNALLRQPGSTVETATYADGSTKQTITREDGSKIVTVRDAELRVLRRIRIEADGTETVLFDDTVEFKPVDRVALRDAELQPEIQSSADEAALREALSRDPNLGRTYSLAQVRSTPELRAVAPAVSLEAVTFRTGSAAIEPEQVDALVQLGEVIKTKIQENPKEVFLIEGHTDAVGDDAYNLALSDRRAETVALALTEYFDVPPENLVVQGYGEKYLKVQTQGDERRNRRAVVRRITPLLTASR